MLTGTGAELESKGGAYPPHPESLPVGVIQHGRYRVRFATSHDELDSILRLRYRVFNLEMGEGLAQSALTERDEDPFDETCHHLLVEHEGTGGIIGTYRMQTGAMAESGVGFYSAGEFDLAGLPAPIVARSIEVGRACIAREHRNRQVLFLLWKGLARYMGVNHKRYLFGCCSLSTLDPAEGQRVMRHLEHRGSLHPELTVLPRPGFECAMSAAGAAGDTEEPADLPSLFRTYLRYGAWVCGPPAIDREFKTIDFLVLFDVEAMEPRSYRLFFDAPLG